MDKESYYKEVGDRIRRVRLERKISQQNLARALSLSRPTIVNIEMGKHRVQLHVLFEMSHLLNVSVGYLSGESE